MITLTQSAAAHILSELKKHGGGLGMRLSIKDSGCSGYAYETKIADSIKDDDEVFETHGAKVIVDKKSFLLIDGTVIDYRQQEQGLNWQYSFDNPRVSAVCGCGESFSLNETSAENNN